VRACVCVCVCVCVFVWGGGEHGWADADAGANADADADADAGTNADANANADANVNADGVAGVAGADAGDRVGADAFAGCMRVRMRMSWYEGESNPYSSPNIPPNAAVTAATSPPPIGFGATSIYNSLAAPGAFGAMSK
jgi:hypothetical protein